MAFFANVLLLRNTLRGDERVVDYLHQVQDNFLEDLGYDTYPFLKLAEELPPLTPEALFYSTGFFNYHNYQHLNRPDYEAAARALATTTELTTPMRRTCGLTVTEYATSLRLQFKVNPAAFAQVEHLASLDNFLDLLRQLIQHPLRQLSDLKQRTPANLLTEYPLAFSQS